MGLQRVGQNMASLPVPRSEESARPWTKKKGFSGAETLGHALVGGNSEKDEAVHDVCMAAVRDMLRWPHPFIAQCPQPGRTIAPVG